MKSRRQEEILELIERRNIETQEELAEALRKRGYRVTQATVSRDIKELHLSKVPMGAGGYRYGKQRAPEPAVSERLIRILRDSLVDVAHAGQMVVVKTLSGSANVAAEAIDTMQWPEILGTIAGDNTIFIVVHDHIAAFDVSEKLKALAISTERDGPLA